MKRFGRSAREQAEFEKFHYPGPDEVLRNKFELRDRELLETFEVYFWAKRAQEGLPEAAKQLDVEGLKAIHRHHLQDVYDWAGEFRTYTTGRGAAPFAPPEQIRPWLDQQFDNLKAEQYLRNMDAAHFAERAAHYVNEINAAHPFIEGNGRTQRVWLRNLAEQAGHHVRFGSEDRGRWYEASRIGFEKAEIEPMASLIRDSLVRGNDHERDSGDAPEFTRDPPTQDRQR